MGVPAPPPKCDATGPFGLDGVEDVSDKPGSSPPTTAPNVPQESQGDIAVAPTEVTSPPPPVHGQSYMTDSQVVDRDQGQDGQPPSGQLPAASGEVQPTAPAALADNGNFCTRVFTPQQEAMSEFGMAPSFSNYEPMDYGNESVGVEVRQDSPNPLPIGNQSPTLSSCSIDSKIVYNNGNATAQTIIDGKAAEEAHAESAIRAQDAPAARPLSPTTRMRINSEKFGAGCFQNIPGCTTLSGCPHAPQIDLSDEERHNNPDTSHGRRR